MSKPALLSFALALQMSPASASAAAGDVGAGKRAFVRCASCHEVGPAAKSGFGPHLAGIIGRPAAAAKDFAGYSTALRDSRIEWNALLRDRRRPQDRRPAGVPADGPVTDEKRSLPA